MYFKLLIVSLVVLQYGSKANEVNTINNDVCPSVSCRLYCPYGYAVDEKGCQICGCKDPCANTTCPTREVCKPQVVVCKKEPCGYEPTCVPECPLRKCVANCPYGYELDNNGCRTCTCIDHCKNQICAKGEVCVTEELCPFSTCGIRPKCIKECPTLPCHLTARCAYGFELDCDNCPTCACKNPCGGVICPEHQYCYVEVVYCFVAPCPPPHPICRSYCQDGSPLLDPNGLAVQCPNIMSCPTGYACNNETISQRPYCCSIPN